MLSRLMYKAISSTQPRGVSEMVTVTVMVMDSEKGKAVLSPLRPFRDILEEYFRAVGPDIDVPQERLFYALQRPWDNEDYEPGSHKHQMKVLQAINYTNKTNLLKSGYKIGPGLLKRSYRLVRRVE